jgi:hypothetical protein
MSVEVHSVSHNAANGEDWMTIPLNHKFDNPVVIA